jgi:fused signal recognition particle receptor
MPPPEPVGKPLLVESDEPVLTPEEPLAVNVAADIPDMHAEAEPVVEPFSAESEPAAIEELAIAAELVETPLELVVEEPLTPIFDISVDESSSQKPAEAICPAETEEDPRVTPEVDVVQKLPETIAEELVARDADESDQEFAPEPIPFGTIVPVKPLVSTTQEKPVGKSLFQRLQERLGKTKDSLVYRLDRLFLGKKEIDQDLFEQLEEILITADLGVTTTLELLDKARKKVRRDLLSDPQALKAIIRDQILAYIEASEQPAELVMPEEGPFVIMVVGVNGVGKTTTIGKIAAKFARAGQSVLLVAGDTFRAAAINQLRIWGERVGVEVIAQNPGADPSSVVYDGLEYGTAQSYDVILIDTAGRLHTSVNLMEELKKIKRVIGKKMPGAPHEVMLVLDATTGQNGISQAKLFHEAVGVSGLTLTKLDGTAKGGIVANVCRETKIPVRFIGIGEQIDDLRDFDAREFVDALFAGQER